jgi:hypothetical protein
VIPSMYGQRDQNRSQDRRRDLPILSSVPTSLCFPRRFNSAVTTRSWFSRCRSAPRPLRLIPAQVLLASRAFIHSTLSSHPSIIARTRSFPQSRRCCSQREEEQIARRRLVWVSLSLRPRGFLSTRENQRHTHLTHTLLPHTRSHTHQQPTTRSLSFLASPALLFVIILPYPGRPLI